MEKTIDRLKSYLKDKGISLNAFDKSIGAANGYIGKQIKNSGSIGSDIIEKIHGIYTDLNLNWLLTGEGEMIKGSPGAASEKTAPATGPPPLQSCPLCQEKEKVIQSQQRTIDILERELHHCKVLYDEEREKGHHTRHDGQKRKAG